MLATRERLMGKHCDYYKSIRSKTGANPETLETGNENRNRWAFQHFNFNFNFCVNKRSLRLRRGSSKAPSKKQNPTPQC